MTAPIYVGEPKGRTVGHVYTSVRATNDGDLARAEAGDLALDDVRSVAILRMLVDTGAVTLGLPIDLIERLGLTVIRSIVVRTANGDTRTNVYGRARLDVQGRIGTFDCIGLAKGAPPLLGCMPMEELGLRPDLVNESLELLPDSNGDTYLLMM